LYVVREEINVTNLWVDRSAKRGEVEAVPIKITSIVQYWFPGFVISYGKSHELLSDLVMKSHEKVMNFCFEISVATLILSEPQSVV